MAGIQATALYAFDSAGSGELSFLDGETLTICSQDVGEGWWEASNSRGERGLVPESYFEITEVPEPNFPPPPAPPVSADTDNRSSWGTPTYNSGPTPTSASQNTRPTTFGGQQTQPQSSWKQQSLTNNNNYRNSVPVTPTTPTPTPSAMPPPPVQNQPYAAPPPKPAAPPARGQMTAQDSYDDWDDDWSDDDSSTTTERPELEGGSSSTSGKKDKKDKENDKFGTVRKPFSKFSNFTKQGGEAYLFNTSPVHVPDSEKKVCIIETEDGPCWQNTDTYNCVIASPKKESKYRGIKSYIAYTLTPSFSNIQVSRRYKHFDWLHKQLEEKFSIVAIPPLPDKQVTGRYEDDFIQGRMQQLQLWMDRMCSHPAVAYSDVVNHFLCCTDEKKWKEGKRRAEKDEYQGSKWFLTLQVPPHRLDATDTEVKMDKFGKYIKNMDDSVRHAMSVGESNYKKHIGPFKKEYSKIGGCFVALAKSFEFDERPVAQNLTRAMESTGRTYEDIGKLFQAQPQSDMLPLLEGLQEYKGILSTFPDTLNVYRAACAKIHENAGRLSTPEVEDVQGRADVIAYATMAEMNHFQQTRVADFKGHMQGYLRNQIQFYKEITGKLESALQQYDNA